MAETKCDNCDTPLTFENSGSRIFCKPCISLRTEHPQKESICGDLVDEKLVDIIDIFYKNDIRTTNSCQEQVRLGNKTWIEFKSITDVEILLLIIKHECDDDFYNYIKDPSFWSINFNDVEDEQWIIYSLRFPSFDLEYFRINIRAFQNQ
jgi:hypothetical protein